MTTWADLTTSARSASAFEALLRRGANVKEPGYGAIGNGIATDTGAITSALAAAAAGVGVCFLPPGTFKADLTIPDGVMVIGSGMTQTIIDGVLTIGSNVVIHGLQFGQAGKHSTLANGADNVLIERFWMRYGDATANFYLNDSSATNVAFKDGRVSDNTNGGNGVQIVDKGTVAKHYENITFTRVRFYANDRFNFECIQRNDVGFPVVTGYRNVSLYDCPMDSTAGQISYDSGILDDGSVRSSGYSTVRGCKITGGSGYGIELAGPTDMLIEGNDVSGTTLDLLSMSQYGTATSEKHIARIRGNKFSGTTNVVLAGEGVSFTGNDVKTSGALRLAGCHYSPITGNTIETTGVTAVSIENSPNNTFTGNTVRGGSNQSFLFLYVGSTDNLVVGNQIENAATEFDVRDGTTQHIGKNVFLRFGVYTVTDRAQLLDSVTYSASMTIDTSSICHEIVVTNGTAMTINAPPAPGLGQVIMIDILNSSGGVMGLITWNAVFKLAGAFTNPASTKHRTISFYYDGANWVETSRAAADI